MPEAPFAAFVPGEDWVIKAVMSTGDAQNSIYG